MRLREIKRLGSFLRVLTNHYLGLEGALRVTRPDASDPTGFAEVTRDGILVWVPGTNTDDELVFISGRVIEDQPRLQIAVDGSLQLGGGTNPPDVKLIRHALGRGVQITSVVNSSNEATLDAVLALSQGAIDIYAPSTDTDRQVAFFGNYNDEGYRLGVFGGGALGWSDGAAMEAAPDLTMFRRVVDGKTQLVVNVAGTEVVIAAEA